MSWEPQHEGYAKRGAHKPTCTMVPRSCACPGVTELWALCDDECALTPNTGKWMFFSATDTDADALWRLAAERTRDGALGWGTKMSIKDKERPALMCFTVDHTDNDDRKRVQLAMRALLEECCGGEVDIRYKTDEATASKTYSGLDVEARGKAGALASQYHDMRTVCRFFQQGKCNRGSACKFLHPDGGGGGGGGGEGGYDEDYGGEY
jgi:hypothetical protein